MELIISQIITGFKGTVLLSAYAKTISLYIKISSFFNNISVANETGNHEVYFLRSLANITCHRNMVYMQN